MSASFFPLSFFRRWNPPDLNFRLLIVSLRKNTPKPNSDLSKLVVAQQGPAPPSPIVVERFQTVISSLFQQRIVRLGGPVDDDMANLVVAQLLYLDASGKVRERMEEEGGLLS